MTEKIMEYKEQYQKYFLLSEDALNQAFAEFNKVPEPLLSAMKYSVNAGGKRLRPVLMFACADMFNSDLKNVFPFAAALEIIHTYSLIHDDLPCMDNDDFRRGIPTNHKVFGEGMAVLAGDGLLNTAFEIMFNTILKNNTTNNIKAAAEIAKSAGSKGMVAGQSLDLYTVNNMSAGEKELLYIHKHKTGKLLRAALVSGAYIANAEKDIIKTISETGEEFGILFQITDDILDVTGTFENLGKSIGKDEKTNKLTYIKLYGMEKSKQLALNSAEKIIQMLGSLNINTDFLKQITLKMLNRNK